MLLYHVLDGAVMAEDVEPGTVMSTDGRVLLIDDEDGLNINGAPISDTDIEASNGVIHVIDEVIVPPGDLVDVAMDEPDLSELVDAVVAADLVEELTGDDPLTVFAPTDDAFEAAESVIDDFDEAELVEALLYHVIPGAVSSHSVEPMTVETVAEIDIEITEDGGALFYGDAQIVITDVVAENGIVHIIDTVVVPSE